MAKSKPSRYRGPNSKKQNKAKQLEKAKNQQTRMENKMKKTQIRNDMRKFNKNYKLQREALKLEKYKANKVADNIRAVGGAVAQNIIPTGTAAATAHSINTVSNNNLQEEQIRKLIESGVNKAGTDNEEEIKEKDFLWR